VERGLKNPRPALIQKSQTCMRHYQELRRKHGEPPPAMVMHELETLREKVEKLERKLKRKAA
jgi:hypothetical protein